MNWKDWFDQINTEENGDSNFGTNCFYRDNDAKKYFRRLEKLGTQVEIGEFGDGVKLKMPKNKTKREQILLFIVTTSPTPTDTFYNKKKDLLELNWS